MSAKSFLGELKRRNVVKVATTYLVIAWLLIEIASLWLSTIGAPAGVITGIATLLVLGFLMTLYISWAFEATPEGMKRTEKVSPDVVLPSWSPRKFALFVITVAFVAAGLHLFGLFRTKPPAPPATSAPGLDRP